MGGGGDGGYGARQDKIDADKTAARAKLNALFGVAPGPTNTPAIPGRGNFMTEMAAGSGEHMQDAGGFNQAGFDAATSAATAGAADLNAEAVANKSGMEKLFSDTRTNAYTAGKRRVDEQKNDAGRNLRFELFARGMNGGSTDIDQNALLGRTYTQGLTDLGAKADATATQLRGDNETARLQLLQSIDSGMDQSSALSSALGQMRVNSDRAASDATGTAIGDLFGSGALIYNQNKVAQGKQNAANWWAMNGGAGAGKAGAGAKTGLLTLAG